MKEQLIGICLCMLVGKWILFLQSGKQYEKITGIVLELLGLLFLAAFIGKYVGIDVVQEYIKSMR